MSVGITQYSKKKFRVKALRTTPVRRLKTTAEVFREIMDTHKGTGQERKGLRIDRVQKHGTRRT